MILRALSLTLVLTLSHLGQAQEKSSANSAPYVFSTKVYQLPSDELKVGFVSEEKGELKAPALPPANASNGELEIFLKRSHEVIKEFFDQQSLSLPASSLACYDPASSTLALRADSASHDLVKQVLDGYLNWVPKYITWTIEIVEAPDSYARASIHEASTISNHHAILESLRAKGKSVVTMQGEAKSGQCISAFHGIKSNDPVEYSIDDKRRSGFKLEPQTWGTLFELEPTLAANNRIVDVNFALTHCHKPGVARREPIAEDSTEKIEVQWIDHPIAMMKSAISMLDGTTQLLGAWALEGETDPARIGLVRAAFLRTHVIKLLPLEEPRVEQILRDNGERFSLTPEVVQRLADPILPNGMETRRFRVPPDFLSLGRR